MDHGLEAFARVALKILLSNERVDCEGSERKYLHLTGAWRFGAAQEAPI
jgi:hypothetical protein